MRLFAAVPFFLTKLRCKLASPLAALATKHDGIDDMAEKHIPGISASGSSDAQSSSILQSPEDDDLISAEGRKRYRTNDFLFQQLFHDP